MMQSGLNSLHKDAKQGKSFSVLTEFHVLGFEMKRLCQALAERKDTLNVPRGVSLTVREYTSDTAWVGNHLFGYVDRVQVPVCGAIASWRDRIDYTPVFIQADHIPNTGD